MRTETLKTSSVELAVTWVHTLVIGSGAAGLNAAVQLFKNGVEDVLIVSEGLQMGTSINTGSDKQTYYKLAICGEDTDAPKVMAENYLGGGSMHGDLALCEASVSARAFLNLVNLGVPFPQDAFGQFVGYKTDHDPRQRATSIGPYTSREMCRALIREVKRNGIPIREGRAVSALIMIGERETKRVAGCIALDDKSEPEVYAAENVVFAVGGPGGLYKASVYPEVHTGAIGLALMAGAKAQGLPESQYGLASTQFRWNVSGTYMQVIPRFISTDAEGGDAREFLREYFGSVGEMNSNVFLKGYQWPFDTRKIPGGSSIVDILVYIETVIKGRRAFLDFRENPEGFSFDDLSEEARQYLTNSQALLETPIARLQKMNPGAIELYKDHGIDVTTEPLEIAVCAQHNNGGLAGDHWWESLNIKHLFPVGEVNGSHGVTRPGGSALNSGQVAGFRAAEYIAHRYQGWTLDADAFNRAAAAVADEQLAWLAVCRKSGHCWKCEREEFQKRMSRAGAHIRSTAELKTAITEAWAQYERIVKEGVKGDRPDNLREAVKNRYLCFAHAVYLEAILHQIESGVGSRGSAMVLEASGTKAHEQLGEEWRFAAEDAAFRRKVLETVARAAGQVESRWVDCRPLPESDVWFETAWAAFRKGEIYG